MKKILISLLSIIFIICMITNVYAATGSISVGASSENVIKGRTFTVTVVGTAEDNITGMQANLSYETDKLSVEDITAGTGFFNASGSNELAIGAMTSDKLSKTATLCTITFKVLDTASEGTTKISVTNAVMALANGTTDPSSDEVTVNIKADETIVGGGSETPDDGNQGGGSETPDDGNQGGGSETPDDSNQGGGAETPDDGNPPSNDNGDNNGGNDGGNNGGNDSSEEKKENVENKTTNKNTNKLPQTGAENASVFVIIILGAILIASYVSYRKYKDI